MSRGTPRGKVSGVECPGCGSIKTRTRATGYGHDNERVRARRCDDCGRRFITIETPVPDEVTWGELVPYSRQHNRRADQQRYGWRARPHLLRPIARLRVAISVTRRRPPLIEEERAS